MRSSVVALVLLLAACSGGEEGQTSVQTSNAANPMLKRAEAAQVDRQQRFRAKSGEALQRRAEDIEATAILRRKLGKSDALNEGERQILSAAANDSGREALRKDPSLALRTQLGARHKGELQVAK